MDSNGVGGRGQAGKELGCDLLIEISVVLTVAVIEQEKWRGSGKIINSTGRIVIVAVILLPVTTWENAD